MDLKVSINSSMMKKIDALSDQLDVKRDELVIKALRKFIFLAEMQSVRRKLSPKVKKMGFKSEEDIFNAIS